ncbi:hypothetical protein PUNSTDRAFT_130399 [Punctularia strigosozonata HHB-11173 SS5]|uniref:uncharacterized protein n=1 Tax=Punctularia strigosozonata (strain HHB-11173) TaxID=741275 RepID=UPI0004418224|nr:uncharacterized protein PUNSTDRAFT_130399 [Punctularia strigosozonata HHB-11173 SS5]EIN12128.1 hypothetical protein PUNSTDRAFT_130399 [Punctularia strigosozonata HHB-11173 SS5]
MSHMGGRSLAVSTSFADSQTGVPANFDISDQMNQTVFIRYYIVKKRRWGGLAVKAGSEAHDSPYYIGRPPSQDMVSTFGSRSSVEVASDGPVNMVQTDLDALADYMLDLNPSAELAIVSHDDLWALVKRHDIQELLRCVTSSTHSQGTSVVVQHSAVEAGLQDNSLDRISQAQEVTDYWGRASHSRAPFTPNQANAGHQGISWPSDSTDFNEGFPPDARRNVQWYTEQPELPPDGPLVKEVLNMFKSSSNHISASTMQRHLERAKWGVQQKLLFI